MVFAQIYVINGVGAGQADLWIFDTNGGTWTQMTLSTLKPGGAYLHACTMTPADEFLLITRTFSTLYAYA